MPSLVAVGQALRFAFLVGYRERYVVGEMDDAAEEACVRVACFTQAVPIGLRLADRGGVFIETNVTCKLYERHFKISLQ